MKLSAYRIKEVLGERCGLSEGEGVVVGVSGGVDSVVLWHLLLQVEVPTVAVHLNYGLRGAASNGDEQFVRALASEWNVRVDVVPATIDDAHRREDGVLGAARKLRDKALGEAALRHDYSVAAVAHSADDQAETFLLQLFRGAGARGLAGMVFRRPLAGGEVTLIRPLLQFSREDIHDYAREHGLAWREDASNNDLRRNRTFVRQELAPRIREHFGQDAMLRVAGAAERLTATSDARPYAVRFEGDSYVVPLSGIADEETVATLLAEFVPEMPRNAAIVSSVLELREAQVGRRVQAGRFAVWRDRDALRFVVHQPIPDWVAVPLGAAAVASTPVGRFSRLPHIGSLPERPNVLVPSVGDFTLRPWKAGDRFPNESQGRPSLVADLLAEAGIPPHRKAGWPVVASSDGIVAIPGLASRRFSTQPSDIVIWRPYWQNDS